MCGYNRSARCVDILGLSGVWIYQVCQVCGYIRSVRCIDISGLPGVWIY